MSRAPARRNRSPQSARGFTLIELLLTVVIIGIIAAVALPAYQQHVMKSRRSEAQTALSQVAQAQERWRSNRAAYASLEDLYPNGLSGLKHYTVTISNPPGKVDLVSGYEVHATPISTSPQARDSACANMFIRVEGGQLSYRDTNMGASDTTSACWPQ